MHPKDFNGLTPEEAGKQIANMDYLALYNLLKSLNEQLFLDAANDLLKGNKQVYELLKQTIISLDDAKLAMLKLGRLCAIYNQETK